MSFRLLLTVEANFSKMFKAICLTVSIQVSNLISKNYEESNLLFNGLFSLHNNNIFLLKNQNSLGIFHRLSYAKSNKIFRIYDTKVQ